MMLECKFCHRPYGYQDCYNTTDYCEDCLRIKVKKEESMSIEKSKEVITSNVDPKMGLALVEAGKKARQDKLTEQCINTVEQLLSMIAIAEQNVKYQTQQLEVYRKRIEAIQTGEIEIVSNGNNIRIVYKDSSISPEVLSY